MVRIRFTPWKALLALLSLGLTFGTCALVAWLLPATETAATVYRIAGEETFVIRPLRQVIVSIVFFISFFGFPVSLSILFRKRLQDESARPQAKSLTELRQLGGGQFAIAVAMRTIFYIVLAFLAIMVVVCLYVVGFSEPYWRIIRVTTSDHRVRLESAYRTWDLPRGSIDSVSEDTSTDESRGRRTCSRRLKIGIEGHGTLTTSELSAKPNGDADVRNAVFFKSLRSALEE